MHRTFILHANGAKLPTDLLGLTCVRYPESLTPAELKTVNQKVRPRSSPRAGCGASRATGGSTP